MVDDPDPDAERDSDETPRILRRLTDDPERLATTARSSARRAWRRALLAVIGVAYGVSVPWYRAGGAEPALWLGLPDWVTVAVACYGLIAVANAAAWLLTDIDDAGPLPATLRRVDGETARHEGPIGSTAADGREGR